VETVEVRIDADSVSSSSYLGWRIVRRRSVL
jgi:hypothetical protein